MNIHFVPKALKKELPIKTSYIGVGSRKYAEHGPFNSWMGHAMHPKESKINPPIGTFYYLFWANRFAREHESKHSAVICDTPLRHDNISEPDLANRTNQKEKILEAIKGVFSLKQVEVLRWGDFLPNDFIYEQNLARMADFAAHSEEFNKFVVAVIPEQYKSNPNSVFYMLEQVSGIVRLSSLSMPVRIGHIMERRIDKILEKLIYEYGFADMLDGSVLTSLYLKGDYSTDVKDWNAGLPPSKEHNHSRRIMTFDSLEVVEKKVQASSEYYQKWLLSILQLSGVVEKAPNAKSLGGTVYECLLLPVQKKLA